MESIITLCAGIDTAEDKLDIAVHGSKSRPQVDNSGAGFKRLLARGKAHKVALIACARKLLIYANTVVSRGQPWRADHATS